MKKWLVGGSKVPPGRLNQADAVKCMHQRGLGAFEIAMPRQLNLATWTVRDILKVSRETGVILGLHGEYGTATLSQPTDFSKAYSYVANALYYARDFNCPVIVHPGGKSIPNSSQVEHTYVRLKAILQDTLVPPELLYLETTGGVNDFGNFEELLVFSRLLNTRICVDWAHVYAYNQEEFTESLVSYIIQELESTDWSNEMYFHMSGMYFNQKGEVKHLPLKESNFPWKMVLDLIKSSSLSGRIILESNYETSEDALLVRDYLDS